MPVTRKWHVGASIQLFGGRNTAGTTPSVWSSDYTILDSVAGTSGISFYVAGTPAILRIRPTLGHWDPGNYWGNIYSTNHVLSGPAAHSVLIGEATANIVRNRTKLERWIRPHE